MKKKRLMKERDVFDQKPFAFVSRVVFFLNLFVSFLIITGAWILVETELGQSSMILGFLMLCISAVMKAIQWW